MSLQYLGTALKYPLQLDRGGNPLVIGGKEAVNQSIVDIIETQLGSKFFLAEYGGRLKALIFEQNDTVLFDLINLLVYEAMSTWETRVSFEKVICTRVDAVVNCEIYYRVLASNEVDSFVYPFYTKLKY